MNQTDLTIGQEFYAYVEHDLTLYGPYRFITEGFSPYKNHSLRATRPDLAADNPFNMYVCFHDGFIYSSMQEAEKDKQNFLYYLKTDLDD